MVMTVIVMMVMRLSSHIDYRCRYCQNGRIFILDELTNTLVHAKWLSVDWQRPWKIASYIWKR